MVNILAILESGLFISYGLGCLVSSWWVSDVSNLSTFAELTCCAERHPPARFPEVVPSKDTELHCSTFNKDEYFWCRRELRLILKLPLVETNLCLGSKVCRLEAVASAWNVFWLVCSGSITRMPWNFWRRWCSRLQQSSRGTMGFLGDIDPCTLCF